MFGYIYKTTCLRINKIYIGQHCKFNKNYLGSGSELLKEIKYCKNKNPKNWRKFFKVEILKYCKNQSQLNNFEKIFIKKFNSTNFEIGLNLLTSYKFKNGSPSKNPIVAKKISENHKGENNPIHKHIFTDEERKIMSERRKGKSFITEDGRKKLSDRMKNRTVSEETRLKLSKSLSGSNNPNFGKRGVETSFYGKTHSKEFSEKHSKRMSGKNNPSFGKKWITNGIIDKYINKSEDIPEGWEKGRSLNNRRY